MPRGHFDATPLVGRRMLDKGDETGGHEPAGTHDLPGPRHFTHLHDATGRDNFDPTPGARGDNVERLHTLPGVHHSLDPVTLHAANDTPRRVDPRADGQYDPRTAMGGPSTGRLRRHSPLAD